jgi:hypothetical protein
MLLRFIKGRSDEEDKGSDVKEGCRSSHKTRVLKYFVFAVLGTDLVYIATHLYGRNLIGVI